MGNTTESTEDALSRSVETAIVQSVFGTDMARRNFLRAVGATTAAAAISEVEILDLDEALTRLGEMDERMARVVELRFFGGLAAREIAHVLGISRRTVQEDWRVARMWLNRKLSGVDNP